MEEVYLDRNLQLLIWEDIKKTRNFGKEKHEILSEMLQCPLGYAWEILYAGRMPNSREIKRLSRAYFVEELVLIHTDLLDSFYQGDYLRENVIFFLKSLRWGLQKELSVYTQVDKQTAYRWTKGLNLPKGDNLRRLIEFINMEYGPNCCRNIKEEPYFLGPWPSSPMQKRGEIKNLIDGMDDFDFNAVYPALLKLLK